MLMSKLSSCSKFYKGLLLTFKSFISIWKLFIAYWNANYRAQCIQTEFLTII